MTTDSSPRTLPSAVGSVPVRAVVAASVGNFVELFDLTVFGFFAAAIGSQFFPAAAPLGSLLGAFATFGVGFLMRPLGALVLGRLGDRYGRKRLLVTSMLLMTAASAGIAVLPPFAVLGVAAPVLLVVLRLLQGLAAGGEWGGAVSMIVESAPPRGRGFVGSFQQLGFALGVFAGIACNAVITSALSHDTVLSWGWRLPFALALVLGPVAWYIRRGVAETGHFERARQEGALVRDPISRVLREHRRGVLIVIGVGAFGTAAGYLGNQFMSSFATTALGLSAGTVAMVLLLAAALQCLLIPLWGALADRIRPLVVIGAAGVLGGLALPVLFALLAAAPTPATLAALAVVNTVTVSASFGPLPAAISALFPTQVRTTALSIGYNLSVAVFGGFAPSIATWLVGSTGSAISPAFYGLGCAVLTSAAVLAALLGGRTTAEIPGGVAARRMLPTYPSIPGAITPTGPWNVAARFGDHALFVAGMRGIDPSTGALVPDPDDRARQAFRNVIHIAASQHFPLASCVRLIVYVTDMNRDRPQVNRAQEELWTDAPHPPRTIIAVTALNQDDVIEVEATFMRGTQHET